MRPVLFEVFGWPVHSYGFMLAIAFLIGIYGVGRSSKKIGVSFDTVIDLGIWVLVGAIVGSRLAYVITEYQYFLKNPGDVFLINSGGLAFHGGLLGGFAAGFWYLRRKQIYPWKLADLVVPFVALGYGVVRIGCLLKGCCYGIETSVFWALCCSGNDNLLRHPTQIYSMIGSLLLFLILWKLRNHKRFPGFLFLLYIGLYSMVRFIVEYFRVAPMVFSWLSLAQLVCIILAILAFGLIIWIDRRFNQERRNPDASADLNR
jgi:phosphatidylglycerol:prolipoprotein diacylglycerol transferase